MRAGEGQSARCCRRGILAGDRERWALLAVGALALLVRALYLEEIRASPMFSLLIGDGEQYAAWARSIAAGDWMGRETFYQAPLYPYFLGVVFALFGEDPSIVRGVQICIGTAACVLVVMAGRRWFSLPAGVVAGVIAALYPPAIFFDGLIQKSVLDFFFVALLLVLLGEFRLRRRWPAVIAAGVVTGCLALTRENALALVPVVAVWIAFGNAGDRWARGRSLVAFALGIAFVLVPVGLRNRAVGGEFLLTTFQFGSNFYLGNRAGATGLYDPLRGGRGSARYERQDAVELAEAAMNRRLTPSEVSRYWAGRAWSDIAADPNRGLRLLLKKAIMVWNATELVDTEGIERYEQDSRVLSILGSLLNFGVLCPLAVMGMWLTRARWRDLWVLYAMLACIAATVALFFVFGRYRFPLVPIAALFAAAGIVDFPRRIEQRRWPAVLSAVLVLIAAAAVSNWTFEARPDQLGLAHFNLGSVLLEEGRPEEAAAEFERGLEVRPASVLLHAGLGRSLAKSGRFGMALLHYQRALSGLKANDADAHARLARLLVDLSLFEEAAAHYEAALRIEPGNADAHLNLGNIRKLQGDLDRAEIHYREAVRLSPDKFEARMNLSALLAERGDAAGSAEQEREAMDLQAPASPRSFLAR